MEREAGGCGEPEHRRRIVPQNGIVRFPRIVPGEYKLVVASGDARWLDEALTVTPSMPLSEIRIPIVDVRGTIHRGDRALAATLNFGGTHGDVAIPVKSKEDARSAAHCRMTEIGSSTSRRRTSMCTQRDFTCG